MHKFRSVFAGVGTFVLVSLAGCAPAGAPAATVPVPTAAVAPTTASAAAATSAVPAPTLGPGPAIKLARVQGFGLFLTDEKDRTLYAFDKDQKDTSTCTGGCQSTWPPYIVSQKPQSAQGINAALVSTFTRTDGSMQGQYDTHPLYYYSGDKGPGEFKGHGIGGVWHVLSPRGSPMTNAAPSAVPTP